MAGRLRPRAGFSPAMTLDSKLLPRAWMVVALLWVVGCLNYLDRVMLTTMRVSIETAIPMTEKQFGLLTTSFLIIYALLSPVAGFLADRFNRSRVVIGSLLVWSAVTWLTGHSKTYNELLATRFLMGISEACFIPAALALVSDYHRGTTRSLATGLLLGGVMIGAALGGLGGSLAEHHDWGFPFSLFGEIGMAYSVILVFFLRDPPREGAQAATPHASLIPVRVGEALSSLFGSGAFIIALIYWGVLGIAGWMIIGWAPTFLQEHFHLTQGKAGWAASWWFNIASLVGLIVGGVWADRWSRTNHRACIYVSALGQIAAVPGILLLCTAPSLPLAVIGLSFSGLTGAFASSEMMPILCLISDPRYRATGYGILNFFSCLVGGITIYAGGVIRDAHIDVSNLFLFGAASFLACGILLFFLKTRSPEAKTA